MASLSSGFSCASLSTESFASYHVDDLVFNTTAGLIIEFGDLLVESLPLGLLLFRVVLLVVSICSLD